MSRPRHSRASDDEDRERTTQEQSRPTRRSALPPSPPLPYAPLLNTTRPSSVQHSRAVVNSPSTSSCFLPSPHPPTALDPEQQQLLSSSSATPSYPAAPSSWRGKEVASPASSDDDWSYWTTDRVENIRKQLGSSQLLSSLSNQAEQVRKNQEETVLSFFM